MSNPVSIERSDSLDSMPSVDFLMESVENLTLGSMEKPKMTEMRRKELAGELKPEPLLSEDPTRFVLFPIKHNDVSPCSTVGEAVDSRGEEGILQFG